MGIKNVASQLDLPMEVLPYEGVGPLRFGMTRADVHNLLGRGTPYFKNEVQACPSEAYDALGINVFFDSTDRLEYVEAFLPATLSFRGVALVRRSISDVLAELALFGCVARQDDGHYFDDLGVNLWAPDEEVEAAGVYRRGYYD